MAVFAAFAGLLFAISVDHTPTTIPFPHLRPIDARLRLLTLGIGYFGVFFGYAAFSLTRDSNRSGHSIGLFTLVSVLSSLCLLLGGAPFSLAVGLSLMAGLHSVIFRFGMHLTRPPLHVVPRYIFRAVLILSPVVGLVGLFKSGLSSAALLFPTYWIGETLQLDFMAAPYGSAIMVGVCFHLFAVMCLAGLALQSNS